MNTQQFSTILFEKYHKRRNGYELRTSKLDILSIIKPVVFTENVEQQLLLFFRRQKHLGGKIMEKWMRFKIDRDWQSCSLFDKIPVAWFNTL